ncbi:MAG: hypothetical protein ACI9WU_000110 [Myxococcota bacterium]|jgi:hypothetical protein
MAHPATLAVVAVALSVATPRPASADTDNAPIFALAWCMDFSNFAIERIQGAGNPMGGSSPEVLAAVGDFCDCLSQDDPAGWLDLYFNSDDYAAVFDGFTSMMTHLKGDVDFASSYLEHLAPCRHLVDQTALEIAVHGPAPNTTCMDIGPVSGTSIPTQHFLRVAWDLDATSIFSPQLPPLESFCAGETAVTLWCDQQSAKMTDYHCLGDCLNGACGPGPVVCDPAEAGCTMPCSQDDECAPELVCLDGQCSVEPTPDPPETVDSSEAVDSTPEEPAVEADQPEPTPESPPEPMPDTIATAPDAGSPAVVEPEPTAPDPGGADAMNPEPAQGQPPEPIETLTDGGCTAAPGKPPQTGVIVLLLLALWMRLAAPIRCSPLA